MRYRTFCSATESRSRGAPRVPSTRSVDINAPVTPKSFPVACFKKSPTFGLVVVTTSARGSVSRNPNVPDATVVIEGTSTTADSIVPRPCAADALTSKRSSVMRPAVPPKTAACRRIATSGYAPMRRVCASSRPVIGTSYPSIGSQVARSTCRASALRFTLCEAGAIVPFSVICPDGPPKRNALAIAPLLVIQRAATVPRSMLRKRAFETFALPFVESTRVPATCARTASDPVPAKVSPVSKKSLKSARSIRGAPIETSAAPARFALPFNAIADEPTTTCPPARVSALASPLRLPAKSRKLKPLIEPSGALTLPANDGAVPRPPTRRSASTLPCTNAAFCGATVATNELTSDE